MDGLNASMAIINELNLDHATIGGDLDFTSSYIEKLSIRGAKVNAITLKDCVVGELDISSTTVMGVVELRHTSVRKMELAHMQLHALEIKDDNRLGELIVRNLDVPLIVLRGTNVHRLDFESIRSSTIQLEGSVWDDADLVNVKADTLSLKGSLGYGVNFGESTIERLKLGNGTAAEIQWIGGHLTSIAHDGDVDGTVAHLRRQTKHNEGAFSALENALVADGRPFEANFVHLQALNDSIGRPASSSVEWCLMVLRLGLLDGRGGPVAYLALLILLVSWGAWFFSEARGLRPAFISPVDEASPSPPVCAAPTRPRLRRRIARPLTRVPEQSARGTPQPDSAYSPWIMSLATLLPGDTLNYLRNYRFTPRRRRDALRVTALQVAALLVQGLLLLSLAQAFGR
jgi:hypothetical protein